MNWDVLDFVVAAALLSAVVAGITVAFRRSPNATYRTAAAVAVVTAFLLFWVNAAVGIIGDEDNDANLLFVVIIACLAIGAAVVRLRPAGMSRVVFAAAALQLGIGIIALAANLGAEGNAWPRDVTVMTVSFAALWLLSGWLFRRAARVASQA